MDWGAPSLSSANPEASRASASHRQPCQVIGSAGEAQDRGVFIQSLPCSVLCVGGGWGGDSTVDGDDLTPGILKSKIEMR